MLGTRSNHERLFRHAPLSAIYKPPR